MRINILSGITGNAKESRRQFLKNLFISDRTQMNVRMSAAMKDVGKLLVITLSVVVTRSKTVHGDKQSVVLLTIK